MKALSEDTRHTTEHDGIIWQSSGVKTGYLWAGDELSGIRCASSAAEGEGECRPATPPATHTLPKPNRKRGEGRKQSTGKNPKTNTKSRP